MAEEEYKDPNTNNEGHTYYPKWVKNAKGDRVIAKNKKEEAEITGVAEEKPKGGKSDKAGW